MAREIFKHVNFQRKSWALIYHCVKIIDEYTAAGFRLTLRQLYYQLVSANIISNTERSYKNLGNLVSNARLCGQLDWNAIEDRIRRPVINPEFDDLDDLIQGALASYRLPRLDGQSEYVELWVEKDALAGVLQPIVRKYHIVLMVNRGYSSQSAMYEAGKRIDNARDRYGCDRATVLYLGDLDPSGEDMVRDIDDRLGMFASGFVRVVKVALTIEQVTEFGLPPNPTKLSDSRAKAFIQEYGRSSWEVDALPPKVLNNLITEALEGIVDLDKMDKWIDREGEDKERLLEAVNGIGDERNRG